MILGVPPSDPPPESTETSISPMLETKGPGASSGRPMSATAILRGLDRDADLPPPPSEPPVDAFVPPAPLVSKAGSPALPSLEEIPTTGWTAPPPAVEEEEEAKVFASTEAAKADLTATIVQGSSTPEEPAVIETPKVDLTATMVQGSSEAEKVIAEAAAPEPKEEPKVEEPKAEETKPNFARTLAFGSKINELPQSERVEVKESRRELRERLREQRAHAQEAQKAISPKEDPDEISVPPANDLDTEDETFFSSAEVAVRKSVHEFEMQARQEEEESVPEKARRKLDPHVIRRRERFAGYVKIAVAGAAFVCLAAVGRSAIHSRTATKAPAATTIAAAPETPLEAVTPKAAEPAAAPVVDTKPAEVKPEEPKPAEPAAAATPEPAEVTGDAKEELKKSRTALEKRKIPEAIEAGERSVALDATDGEAWLILGAAYQEKGDMVNARRCYGACVKQGKTGPRLECQKMLRF